MIRYMLSRISNGLGLRNKEGEGELRAETASLSGHGNGMDLTVLRNLILHERLP